MRWPKRRSAAAYSASVWIGCQSPLNMAKPVRSDSVIVRARETEVSPTAMSST